MAAAVQAQGAQMLAVGQMGAQMMAVGPQTAAAAPQVFFCPMGPLGAAAGMGVQGGSGLAMPMMTPAGVQMAIVPGAMPAAVPMAVTQQSVQPGRGQSDTPAGKSAPSSLKK